MGGSLDMVRTILKEEGLSGLFAGNLYTVRSCRAPQSLRLVVLVSTVIVR